jgi:probable F420-dependent oxidoreductase
MKFDAVIHTDDLKIIPDLAQRIEAMGFDGLWTSEVAHSPYFPLVLAGNVTQRISMGTAIAVAFARSPTITAYEAWDLARLTNGRFILGLGTQIKAHITRRFGMTWDQPGARLREYILALRALWQTFQENTPLNFRGEYYKLTYLPPFFQPPPVEYPHIPIFIAGVQQVMCQLAGELCEGFHVHPLHTIDYLRNFTLPNIEKGLEKAGRQRQDIELMCPVFVVTSEEEKILVKSQIAFYASTPNYRGVLETHGLGEIQDRLALMTRRGQWNDMHQLISDDLLNRVAVVAPPDEIAAAVKERYTGLLDRVSYYFPYVPGERDVLWQATLATFH